MGFLRKLEKSVRKVVKPALPIVGSLVGAMLGGPVGATVGGSLGGALSSKRHRLDHALGGAAIGLGGSFLAPKIGAAFGADPSGNMGKLLGMGHPGFLQQMGFSSSSAPEQVSNMLGPAAYMGQNRHQQNQKQQQEQLPGLLSSLGLDSRDLLNIALGTAGVAGHFLGKETLDKKSMELLEQSRPKWGPEHQPRPENLKPYKRQYIQPPKGYQAGYEAEHKFLTPLPEYARGGYIDGSDGGQDDTVPIDLPKDSYVMDATTVSLLGDGNSLNGKQKLEKFQDRFVKSGIVRGHQPYGKVSRGGYIKAKVSPGEFIMKPETLVAIGKGNADKGAKIMNKFRTNIRKQKGVKKFLPPKSKHATAYMR